MWGVFFVSRFHRESSRSEWNGTLNPTREPLARCLNTDFHPEHKYSVWTMLNDNEKYILGAMKIGKALKSFQKNSIEYDIVVMELSSKPLSDAHWKALRAAGWMKCTVESIHPPKLEKTRKDLREKFAVLHVWQMEPFYERIVFVDADTYIQNPISHLFTMDLKHKALGVTRDIRGGKWVDTFNSGVMVLKPSQEEFQRLLNLLWGGLEYEYVMSDQGFLNEIYKNNWHEIGFENNANLAVYAKQNEFWNRYRLQDINIIHYTMQKPWACKPKGPYGPICKVWQDAA